MTIETDEPAYPYRRTVKTPVSAKSNASGQRDSRHSAGMDIIYPVGCYRTVLCGPELEDAVAHRRVVRWHGVATYELDYSLQDYARAIYSIRCAADNLGDKAMSSWAKRLLVSLPGKLGQRSHEWIDCPEQWTDLLYGEWYAQLRDGKMGRFRSLAGHVQRDVVSGYAPDALPAVAGWITSAARLRLLEAIRCAGWESVYYYDTDSLFVSREGYDRLCAGQWVSVGELGRLELRGVLKDCEIRGIKYYVEDGRVVCAGLPRGDITDLGDGVNYVRHLTPAEQIRHKDRPDATYVVGRYQRANAYTHGVVGDDGRVSPIEIWEE